MTTQKPAAGRLPLRAARTAFLALLLVGVPLAAHAQRSSHGSGGGGGRTAHPSGGSHSSGGGSGSGGRSAHGVPGGSGPHRQPSGHDHGGHGGHGHGGYYGGHYGGYGGYYSGWGWGFYPSFSWWWGYPYYPYYYPYGYGYGYGGYGYDGYGYGGYGGYSDSRDQSGALDLDISPGQTHVFVNGEDLGPVDRYDGWPGYLWLPRGTYDVAFYLDGFKTLSRQVTVYPGTVLDMDDHMEQGPSVRPEDLASKTHERRDQRLRYEQQRRDDLDRQGYRDDEQDWHDRVRHDRPEGMRGDHPEGPAAHDGRGSLRLDVDPDDSSVYLDGHFVGTGADLSMMQGGLSVAPGDHRLAIVRPGHKAEEQEFQVQAGQEIRLNIHLEDDSR